MIDSADAEAMTLSFGLMEPWMKRRELNPDPCSDYSCFWAKRAALIQIFATDVAQCTAPIGMTNVGGAPKARRRHDQIKEGRLGSADLDRLAIHLFLHRWEQALGGRTLRIDSHTF
jgi:hypothetical protein